MLPKIAFLAVALQAALSTAHVEQPNGKDLLVKLNTPGTTHRHLVPIKHNGTVSHNPTTGSHKDDFSHGVRPHKAKHGKGKNGIEGKLHGGPAKYNGTQGHHTMERRTEAVHHGQEKGDGNGPAHVDNVDHSHGHAHKHTHTGHHKHNSTAHHKGDKHKGHGKHNGTVAHTPGINDKVKGHPTKEARAEGSANFAYGKGKGHEVGMDASHGHGRHGKGGKGKIQGAHGKHNGTAAQVPGKHGKGKDHQGGKNDKMFRKGDKKGDKTDKMFREGNKNGTKHDKMYREGADHNSLQTRQVGGNAILGNRCDYDIWVWSVDQDSSSPSIRVPARTRYTEPKRAPAAGGVVLKVSRTDQLQGGQQTQFEYATNNNIIYYDISFVDCATGDTAQNCPGWDGGLGISSPEPACPTVNCASNSYCTDAAYFVDTPLQKLGIAEPVFGCGTAGTGMDVYFVMCSEKPALSKRELTGRGGVGKSGLA